MSLIYIQWVLYNDFVLTNKNFLRTVTDVKGAWLYEIAPDYFNPRNIKNIDTRRELEKIER